MKEMIRYGFILAVICTIASASLAGVNYITKAKIIGQAKAEEEDSLREVLPEAQSFEPVRREEEVLYYKAYDADRNFIGAAFKAAGKGYSSTVESMVGMDRAGKVTAVKVLSQNETPGLGANVAGGEFTGQFTGKDIKSLGDVQAITGATISSKAVIDSVKKKAQEVFALIKNEK